MDTSRGGKASAGARLHAASLLRLGGIVAVCLGAGRLGSMATVPHLEPWYHSLAKPAFNPPDWLFPVVWTALFVMMAVAFWRVLERASGRLERKQAFAAFVLQLVINVAWSFVFFGTENPAAGLVAILALLAAIVWTIVVFGRTDGLAAALLMPYLGWVAYAALLNASIWWLNR